MCGIAGFYGFKNNDLIRQISKQIEHRGPDGEGFFYDGETATLVNRRLAIIDRQGGDQPIFNEDDSIVVVYNGEIYNFKELKRELEKAGHIFKTKTDTEVIVHAYELWGEACFEKFNGMFAIALYDKKKKKLVLARDHFGIKPLYFSRLKNNSLIFSSEISPIINSGMVKKTPNDRIIYRYLAFRVHDDNEETFFKGINRLMPGQMLIVEKEGIKLVSYSKLQEEVLQSEEQAFRKEHIEQFKDKLETSLRMRLVSEVPVGTSFSGGLDSSTVVAMVHELLKKKDKDVSAVGNQQNTFSAVFPNSSNNEEEYIDKLIRNKREISSHKVFPTPEEFFAEIEEFVKTQEEPTISTGPYAQYKVMQEAKKYVTVLLDGQGADEMLAGYLPYYFVYLRELRKKGRFLKLLIEMIMSLDILFKFSTIKLRTTTGFNKVIPIKKILTPEFMQKHKEEVFETTNDDLKKRLSEDIFQNSLPSLLRYEDKNSMKYSIEGRVPYLDFELLRFVFGLTPDAIIKHGWNKYILRKSVNKLLPRMIVKRRDKIGFTTPENEWFLRMKNKIYGIFLSESFASRSYLNQAEIIKAFQKFIEEKTDDSMLFWRFINLEIWLRVFFDPPSRKASEGEVKKITPIIAVGKKKYIRELIKTDVFDKGDDYVAKISSYVVSRIEEKKQSGKWFAVISEKIVAISQGRSYFLWEIHPKLFAKFLSRFVKRTPHGIGLGSPWTMQLAIQEVGLPRILLATFLSAITKPLGIKGVFYHVAGRAAASIDGPTEYSLYPSNVSAKLGPKNPQGAAEIIHANIYERIKNEDFLGVVILDANDLGRDVLGNTTKLSNKLIEEIFRDNPMGQGREQTPIAIVTKN